VKKSRVVKRQRALRDLEERSLYIGQHNARAAHRFLEAARSTIRKLAASPRIGTRYEPDHPALAELRFLPVTGFKNDLIFYRVILGGVEIVRVLHGARDIAGVLGEEFGIDTSGGEADFESRE
jgi:toxin ParE1/3/4